MSSSLWLDPFVIPIVDGLRILDVACGEGKWGFLLRTNWWSTSAHKSKPNNFKGPALLIGVDIYLPYLLKVKHHRIYDEVVLCDAPHLPFRTGSFNVVLACEILEHLKKKEGQRMLKEIERVSGKTTIITTPQDPQKPSMDELCMIRKSLKELSIRFLKKRSCASVDACRQRITEEYHMYRWTPKELESLGYDVETVMASHIMRIPLVGKLLVDSPFFNIISKVFPSIIVGRKVKY